MLEAPGDRSPDDVLTWLTHSGFRPEEINFDAPTKQQLLSAENAPPCSGGNCTVTNIHAFNILSTIPLAEEERRHALNTAKFVIRLDDHHGNTVWGLVCIDSPTVSIRWSHRVSRSLEHATEELVLKIWKSCGPGKLFQSFSTNHIIPVREPLSTSEAYFGEILSTGELLKQRAKADKKTEIRICWIMFFAALSCSGIGYILLDLYSSANSTRWFSGVFDRLATAALATAAVSYLNYFCHLSDLRRKPIIDWK